MSRQYGAWNDQNLNPDNYPAALRMAYAYHAVLKKKEDRALKYKRRKR